MIDAHKRSHSFIYRNVISYIKISYTKVQQYNKTYIIMKMLPDI